MLHDHASQQPLRPECYMAIEVTYDTLTRMIIDIAHSFNVECGGIEMRSLAPTFMHVVRGAQQYMISAEKYDRETWLRNFDALARALEFSGRRWVLASKWKCQDIDSSMAADF